MGYCQCDKFTEEGRVAGRAPDAAVAVDLAVLTVRDDALQILMIERGTEPYLGRLALPGGFVERDESLDAAAGRELREETGLTRDRLHLEQLRAYGAPNRSHGLPQCAFPPRNS